MGEGQEDLSWGTRTQRHIRLGWWFGQNNVLKPGRRPTGTVLWSRTGINPYSRGGYHGSDVGRRTREIAKIRAG